MDGIPLPRGQTLKASQATLVLYNRNVHVYLKVRTMRNC